MATCYITFGQKYGRETHPVDDRAHPDGWFEFEADTYAEALAAAQAYFMGDDGYGSQVPLYAFDYDTTPGGSRAAMWYPPGGSRAAMWYPRGCLNRFQVRDGRAVEVPL